MSLNPQKAVILAGSLAIFDGIPLTHYPKILLPIANIPLIDYTKSLLEAAGVKRIMVLLDSSSAEAAGYLSEHFKGSSPLVESVVHHLPRGTGGSLKEIEGWLQGESFWVVNGDLFFKTDLREMLAQHRELGTLVTIGSTRINETAWYKERIQVESGQRVKTIHRIHPAEELRSMLRPAGLYLCEPSILNLMPEDSYFDLKEQLFPLLYKKGTPAFVWEINGYCRAIYNLDDYFAANRDVLLKHIQFPQLIPSPDVIREPLPHISLSATLLDPLAIGSAARIGDGAMVIGPTALGERCEVDNNTVINECVVFEDAKIGRSVRLDRCIVGKGSVVGNGSSLRETIIVENPSEKGKSLILFSKLLGVTLSERSLTPQGLKPAIRIYLRVRRAFELVVAATGLILSAPLILLISLAIKLDSEGEIFFRQVRCGQHGRVFNMFKFRSMVKNAEEVKKDLKWLNEVDGPMFKITEDPRTTRVGRFLRATNLDELPQLWNVLWGQISLVGPRPLSINEMRLNPRWRDIRLMVPQGITGLWQVKAHSKVTFNEWIQQDIDYVLNLSPWLDMKILLKTIINTFRNFARLWRRL